MPALLIRILVWFASGLIARVLLGAGLGIFTFTFLNDIMSNLKNAILNAMQGFPADITQILGLLQVDFYISIILSALTMAAFIKSSKLALGKV